MNKLNMQKDIEKHISRSTAETNAEVGMWIKKVQQNSVSDVINANLLEDAVLKSSEMKLPLPLILTLCPAVFNLNFPTSKGQTREFVPIEVDNQRMRSLFEEIFGFQATLKKDLGIDTEMFIIFADSLEKGADKMITNPQDISSISQESVKSIREIMVKIDQSKNGLFQKLGLKIPKIRLQSNISQQGGSVGLNRESMINQFETNILDPNSELFKLWTKHLVLARNDAKFTETSWQGLKSAETIWTRMRFLIAELATDGIFLPEVMKKVTNQNTIEPIFIASSVRKATLTMEADCFNIKNQRVLLPVFRNMGRWLEPSEESPWIDILRNV